MPKKVPINEEVVLQNVCSLITDGKHGDCKNEDGSGYYFLSAKDVIGEKLQYAKARQITEGDFVQTHKRTQLEPLDILISNSGTIGRMAIAKESELTKRTTFQKSVAILKPNKERVHPRWLFYCLLNARDDLISAAGGTAQKNLLLRDLRFFKIELSPLPTQRKIASVLSAYDDLIENNNRRIEILEEMAQRIYREWFVHFRFPGHEKVGMVDSELGTVPEGWEVKKLGDVVELAYGKALKKDSRKQGSIPVYGSGGIVGYHDENLVDGPGIIVGRKGNVGSVYWSDYDFFPIDTVYYVQTNTDLHYVYYNLQDQNFLNNDAAVPGLNRNQAYSLPFLLPDASTLGQFQLIADPIFQQLKVLKEKNDNLRSTRDLLLPKLVSGEIEVGNLDQEQGEADQSANKQQSTDNVVEIV